MLFNTYGPAFNNPFAPTTGSKPGLPQGDLFGNLRDANASVEVARAAVTQAITGRKPAPAYDAKLDRLTRDTTRYAAGVANAERNLNYAAVAGDAVDKNRAALEAIRDAITAARDGTGDGSEQAKIDELVAELDRNDAAQFAGRDVFTSELRNVHADDRDPVRLTDHEGYFLFDKTDTSDYGNQNWSGNDAQVLGEQAVGDHAREITLEGNNWQSIALGSSQTVTDDMYVEFELRTTGTSEIVGIALDNNNSLSAAQSVQLAGVQNWAGRVDADLLDPTDDEFLTYRVKATDIAALGSDFDRLVLINDRDAAVLDGTSTFRNVRIVSDAPVPTGLGDGLRQRVYTGKLGDGGTTQIDNRAVTDLTNNWGGGGPVAGVNDNYSVRWNGRVQAEEAGSYQFRTRSDDGVRVWIDGDLVIDNWTNHGPTYDYTTSIDFEQGESKSIKVEYYEAGGGAVLALQWNKPTSGWTDIAPGQLYRNNQDIPTSPGTLPMMFDGVGVEATSPRAAVTGGEDRQFNTGPSIDRGTSFGTFAGIAADQLGTRANGQTGQAEFRISSLVTGGENQLSNLLNAGDYDAALTAVEDGLAQLRYVDAQVGAFARSMRADVNVGTFAMDLLGKAGERVQGIRDAEAAAEKAKQAMKAEADLLRLNLAAADPYTALMMLK